MDIPFSKSLDAFNGSPFPSIKHTNYFEIYDRLFGEWVGKEFTFVEIGVLDGGSLFMWRDFFGNGARIIGVDLNPDAAKWIDHGFEIYIGNQADSNFLQSIFQRIGPIGILLDDGGHLNFQQIVTVQSAIPFISNGGLIVIEDTHTSFLPLESFTRNTLVSFLKKRIDSLYAQNSELRFARDIFSNFVHSMEFYNGVCALKIRHGVKENSERVSNFQASHTAVDLRYSTDANVLKILRYLLNLLTPKSNIDSRPSKIVRIFRFFQKVTLYVARKPIYFLICCYNDLLLRSLKKKSLQLAQNSNVS